MQRALSQQWIKDVCLQSAQKDKTESVARAMVGFLKPNELAQFIASRPLRIEMHAVRLLEGKLGELHSGNLQQLARKYDPCGHLVTTFARRRQVVARRSAPPASTKSPTASPTPRCNYSSCAELNALLQPQPAALRGDSLSYLLLFFVKILMELVSRRQNDCLHADCAILLLNRVTEKAMRKEAPSAVRRRAVSRPVACRAKLVAAISDDGCVQTWDTEKCSESECEPTSSQQQGFRFSLFREMGVTVLSLACGAEHSVSITNDGVYAWGSSRYGQLGIGAVQWADVPTRIPEFCCVDIACGHYHTLAITEDGRLWSWGRGAQGQLGTGSCDDVSLPTAVTPLAGLRVAAAAGGQAHSLVLTSEGDVYSFGCSSFGQLGTGDTGAIRPWPTPMVALDEPVRLIATHSFHSIAVTVSNAVYAWGVSPPLLEEAARALQAARDLRMDGSCDHETVSCFLASNSKPRKVSTQFSGTIVQVSCTALHTLALTSAGQLYAWGCDIARSYRLRAGRPGASRQGDAQSSRSSGEEEEPAVTYVAGSSDFCVALDEQGRLLAWGRGSWLANKQEKDAVAPDGLLLPPAAHVLLAPAAGEKAQRRSSSSSLHNGLARNDLQRCDAITESGILELSGHAAYSLHLIPCIAKLYGGAFPMAAAQAALAKLGALDVIAALLLVQEQYEKAFQCHLEALLSCKHHTPSAFAHAFATTVDVYRRLALATAGQRRGGSSGSGKESIYRLLLAKAIAFASCHGIDAEDPPPQRRRAAAPATTPISAANSALRADDDSLSPEPNERLASKSRLAAVPRPPAMPAAKRSWMTAADSERASPFVGQAGRHGGSRAAAVATCHVTTKTLPLLVPKAEPTSIGAAAAAAAHPWCNRLPARPPAPPRQWQAAEELLQARAHYDESEVDRKGCWPVREAAAAARLANTQGAPSCKDDEPTDLSMKGMREHPHPEKAGGAAAAATAAACRCASDGDDDTVEFCCGHSFVRQAFVGTVLPRFLAAARGNAALSSCSGMLMDMYQRTDICALACPDCVASAVGRL